MPPLLHAPDMMTHTAFVAFCGLTAILKGWHGVENGMVHALRHGKDAATWKPAQEVRASPDHLQLTFLGLGDPHSNSADGQFGSYTSDCPGNLRPLRCCKAPCGGCPPTSFQAAHVWGVLHRKAACKNHGKSMSTILHRRS